MYICDIYCFYDLMFKMTDHLQPQGNSSPASETLSKVFSQLLKHSDIKTLFIHMAGSWQVFVLSVCLYTSLHLIISYY